MCISLRILYTCFTTWPMSLLKPNTQPGYNRHNTNPPQTIPGLNLTCHRNPILRLSEPCVDLILQEDVVWALSRARHDG